MNVVAQPAAALYDAGYRLPRVWPRYRQTVTRPAWPLYEGGAFGSGLGAVNPAGIVAASAPIVGTVTTGILATSTATAGTALSALAGPIGAGVAVLVSVIAGLWAAHNARVAGARHENEAINSAVATWDAGMKAIFAAANSSDPTRNVSGAQAAAQVQQLWGQFWAQMNPYMHAAGTADTSGGGVNCGSPTLNPAGACSGTIGGHKCDASCTATCCVGCQDLHPSMLEALQVLNSPAGGTVQVCQVSGSKYGAQARSGYTLTFSPPAITGGGGAGASIATDLGSSLTSLFGGSSSAGSTGSLPLLLAFGALAFLMLKS